MHCLKNAESEEEMNRMLDVVIGKLFYEEAECFEDRVRACLGPNGQHHRYKDGKHFVRNQIQGILHVFLFS